MVEDAVCCMCGDVGFSDKLFRCSNCRHRFQHSYCSNYYYYYSENRKAIKVCDWCQSEEKKLYLWSRQLGRSSSSPRIFNINKAANANKIRSVCGVKIGQHVGGASAVKVTGKAHSHRPTTRRYKLLKDVMC